MNKTPHRILQKLVPFLVLGMSIALILGILFVFAYVLVWGLIIGSVLWLIYALKTYFFPPKSTSKPIKDEKSGRIIEHDEDK